MNQSDSADVVFRLIQGADIGWHGTFQKLCDKRFLAGKQELLIAKQKAAEAKQCKAAEAAEAKIPVKLTASEKRDLIVEVASKVWFDDIREADIVSAGLRSGLAVAADCSEDCKVDVVCPSSGKRLFPSRDGYPLVKLTSRVKD